MQGRLTSGDEGLDLILGGGLPMSGINLIIGLPGSGKTILSQQFVFAGATEERPAIYLSTVSEPFEKIVRYAQTLSFFDRHAIGRTVYYEDLGGTVGGDGGLAAVIERVGALIKERRPGIIAIDSFKALAAFSEDAREFRRFLHDLAALLTAFPATCFWIGEYSEDETGTAPEFAVADGIISLATQQYERAHVTPDPGEQAAGQRLPLRTSHISPLQRRNCGLSTARRSSKCGRLRVERRQDLDRHPATRHHAGGGLCAG